MGQIYYGKDRPLLLAPDYKNTLGYGEAGYTETANVNSLTIKSERGGTFVQSLKVDGDPTNFEIYATFRLSNDVGKQGILVGRYSGTSEATTKGYMLSGSFIGGRGVLAVDEGQAGYIATAPWDYQAGVTYDVRYKIQGTRIQAKVWPNGQPEPASWMIDVTDSKVTSSGWIGVATYNIGLVSYTYIGIGTNGDPAPVNGRINYKRNTITGYFPASVGGALAAPFVPRTATASVTPESSTVRLGATSPTTTVKAPPQIHSITAVGGTIPITSTSPLVGTSRTIQAQSSTIAIGSTSPSVATGNVVVAENGNINPTSSQPSLSVAVSVHPSSGAIQLSSTTPGVSQKIVYDIGVDSSVITIDNTLPNAYLPAQSYKITASNSAITIESTGAIVNVYSGGGLPLDKIGGGSYVESTISQSGYLSLGGRSGGSYEKNSTNTEQYYKDNLTEVGTYGL